MRSVLEHVLARVNVRGHLDERCELAAPWSLSREESADGAIPYHIVMRGSAILTRSSGASVELGAGDVLLLPAGEPHKIREEFVSMPMPGMVPSSRETTIVVDRRESSRSILLCGRFVIQREWCRLLKTLLPPVLLVKTQHAANHDRLRHLVAIMQEESREELCGSSSILRHLSAALFGLTLRAATDVQQPAVGLLALARHPRLSEAALRVLESPGEPWGIQDIADLSHMSRSSVIRAFYAVAGVSPAEFVLGVRIAASSQMLIDSRSSVASIAEAVGYASESAFQRAFKRKTGLTPAAWRGQSPHSHPTPAV